jgi:membrane protease YdiL (CAAX protease family)
MLDPRLLSTIALVVVAAVRGIDRHLLRHLGAAGARSVDTAVHVGTANPLVRWRLGRFVEDGIVRPAGPGYFLDIAQYRAERHRRRRMALLIIPVLGTAGLAVAFGYGRVPDEIQGSLTKLAIPTGVILFIALMVWRRRWSWARDVGVTMPSARQVLFWMAIWLAWMLGTNAIVGWRGPWDFTSWRQQSLAVSAIRVTAVGVLGPVAEDLLFRGILFFRLARTRLGPWGSAVTIGIVWAALHSYAGGIVALLAVSGLLLGAARVRSRSVVLPLAMHVAWNLYAIW